VISAAMSRASSPLPYLLSTVRLWQNGNAAIAARSAELILCWVPRDPQKVFKRTFRFGTALKDVFYTRGNRRCFRQFRLHDRTGTLRSPRTDLFDPRRPAGSRFVTSTRHRNISSIFVATTIESYRTLVPRRALGRSWLARYTPWGCMGGTRNRNHWVNCCFVR